MKETGDAATVTILGKEFMVACPEDQRNELFAAARLLDSRMREIQSSGKVIGSERCAIMAALNIAAELLTLKSGGSVPGEFNERLRQLQSKIDFALQGRSSAA
jgi:cell division protein ZapA